MLTRPLITGALLAMLASCSWGQFEFRGLSRWMSCTEAVEQERRSGSRFVRMEVTEESRTSHVRREFMAGSLEGSPADIVLECIEIKEGSEVQYSTLFGAAYMARIANEHVALAYHERVRAMLARQYGEPSDRVAHPYQDSPAAKAKGTSGLTLRIASFGCVNTTLGIGDHSLGLITQYPVADHTMFETTVSMRFQGGVC